MSLDQLVTVTISATAVAPTEEGFGTPMIVASDLPAGFVERVRTYTSLAGMVSDGFATTHPAYEIATILKSQPNTVTEWKVGRRVGKATTIVDITPTSTVVGTIYSFQIKPVGSTNWSTITYTVVTSDDVSDIVTGLVTALATKAGVTITDATTKLTLTSTTAGTFFDIRNWSKELTVHNVTIDPATSIATDLAAIYAEDSDWFGLLLDSNSAAEIAVAAVWAEANRKLFGCDSSDTAVQSSGSTTDIAYVTHAAGYAFTYGVYHGSQMRSYAAAGWMGEELAYSPDVESRNWAYKRAAGVAVDNPTSSGEAAVRAKKWNTYTQVSGVKIFLFGTSASGEYIDITLGTEWMRARMQEAHFANLANTAKTPYTQAGIDKIEGITRAVLRRAEGTDFLAKGSSDVVAPKIADVSSSDKAARRLRNVLFSATFAGAINTLTLTGTVVP